MNTIFRYIANCSCATINTRIAIKNCFESNSPLSVKRAQGSAQCHDLSIRNKIQLEVYIFWATILNIRTEIAWHSTETTNGDPHQPMSEFPDHQQQNRIEKTQYPSNRPKTGINRMYTPSSRSDRRFTAVHNVNTTFSKAITHCHRAFDVSTHSQGCYGGNTSNTHPDLSLEYFCLLPKSFQFVLAVALALLLHLCADFSFKLAPKVTRQMATVVRERLLPLPVRSYATNSTLQQAQKPHQLIKRCGQMFFRRKN